MKDWPAVRGAARKIFKVDRNSAEGHFLSGLAEAGTGRSVQAARAFKQALQSDTKRYDAAIELMRQSVASGRPADAFELLNRYEASLDNSPYYLEMAADTAIRMGLHERAYRLYRRATELQPEIQRFGAGLAASAVLVGEIDQADNIYRGLLEKNPQHQRNHYELAKLKSANNFEHVESMKDVLLQTKLPEERNIFLCYALGKELEDLGEWDESFRYLKLGGDAAKRVSGYDVAEDERLVDTIIETCGAQWLAAGEADTNPSDKVPIFVVGLPRTGTTLVERILSSHSAVQSVDETHFVEMALKRCTGIRSRENLNETIVKAAAGIAGNRIADTYMECVNYRLGSAPYFIDKYPENFYCAGFIARSFPQAKIVQVTRHPMDACFAMYKQSYFRYAYSLADLGRYYLAYRRLRDHWASVLGDRIVDIGYESLVADQEQQTRTLLEKLRLPFEEGCLRFHENITPSATASTIQVREKIHSRSVGRWKHYAEHLEPLRKHLDASGIDVA
jgi:tetratricopeptide (TPR) repeat protein